MKVMTSSGPANMDLSLNKLPREELREIRAEFDNQGVYVYQAFRAEIAKSAVALGTFGPDFSLNRFTWIKPSLGWMLYRSRYAENRGQEAILRIKIGHQDFQDILRQVVPAIFEPGLSPSVDDWHGKLKLHDLRFQWDPGRDLSMQKIPHLRSLQIGIGPSHIRQYVNNWIMEVTDVTEAIKKLRAVKGRDRPAACPFVERVYDLPVDIKKNLGMQTD